MQIFFSHASRDKPLLREVRRLLPGHISVWIDELEIPAGDDLTKTIKSAIQSSNDVVVFFLGPEAVRSQWVKKELHWAIEHERRLDRSFIIPVVLDAIVWSEVPRALQDRKYLTCLDFTETAVKHFAQRLYEELFRHFLLLVDGGAEYVWIERKKQAYQLASVIADDQSTAGRDEKLSKPRLKKLISLIDARNKILLLCLYELVMGKFASEAKRADIERANLMTVEFRVSQLGIWVHRFDWSSQSTTFRSLTFEYGLGNARFLVRDVFLRGIHSLLREDERRTVFNGITIDDYSLDSWTER